MTQNIINTVGQHVFRYDPPKFIEKDAPFRAKNPTAAEEQASKMNGEEPRYQFLGEGYYFWDHNIGRAHKWGTSHYNGKYLILEADMVLSGDKFLDMVGSREDLRIFIDAYEYLKKRDAGLKVGAFFKVMQTIAKYQPAAWPFTIIRALNVKRNGNFVAYNHLPNSDMLLDPEIIICFYDKKELNLQNTRYFDKNNNPWTPRIS